MGYRTVRELRADYRPALSEAGVEHQGFWSVIVLAVLILSGFAGFSTLAAGAPWTSATVRGPPSNVVVVYANDFQNVGTITLSVAGVSLTSIAATWTAVQNQSVTNYTLVYSTVGPNGPFTGRVSEGSSLSATISSLAPDTTYWLRVWAWDSGTLVLMSNVGPAQTLSPIPPAPVIPVSLTIPQVVVISTFMALIVAGLIAAGTRKKKRNRNGYPMSD